MTSAVWAALLIGVAAGVVGTLSLQVGSARFSEWWYGVLETARAWAATFLGLCGILFIVCCVAYASGWRP